jgi:hypothetical protein
MRSPKVEWGAVTGEPVNPGGEDAPVVVPEVTRPEPVRGQKAEGKKGGVPGRIPGGAAAKVAGPGSGASPGVAP